MADDESAQVIGLRRTYDGGKTHEPEVWLRKMSQSSSSAQVTLVADGLSVKLAGLLRVARLALIWGSGFATGPMRDP